MSTMAERRKIARLYLVMAAMNDYRLVVDGSNGRISWDDLKCAEQELIDGSNARQNANPVYELALDLIELDIQRCERGVWRKHDERNRE